MAAANDTAHLLGHVADQEVFELPFGIHIPIPQPLAEFGVHITKFMLLEVVAAALIAAAFIGLARRIADGRPPKGRLWNFLEAVILYMRDEVIRPAIGGAKDAEPFLPLLWTVFLFVLFCNLLGMVPWMGSATGAMATTAVMAALMFFVTVGTGMYYFGPLGFLKNQVPHMELPLPIAIVLIPMLFVIEIFGLLVKHFVLAVRLLANMFAGHVVLVVIMSFIVQTARTHYAWFVWPAALFGATFISLLELFVAFLQAYIFTFLAAIFIGMARHPH